MFGGPRLVGSASSGGYGSSGSVVYVPPPEWDLANSTDRPVLFGFPGLFSPLAQAASRGMKETVTTLLKHSSKKHAFVDEGYKSAPPNGVSITPLQIAAMNYTGSYQVKYLNIATALVAHGANINSASFWVQTPDPDLVQNHKLLCDRMRQTQEALKKVRSVKQTIQVRLDALKRQLTERFGTMPPADFDQSELLTLERDLDQYEEREEMIVNTMQDLKQNLMESTKAIQVRRMINPSAYAIALKMRHTSSDTALIEAMVDGAIQLKDAIFESVTEERITEGTVQIIVEFVVGLSLRKWDV